MKFGLLFFSLLLVPSAWSQSIDSLLRQAQIVRSHTARLRVYAELGYLYGKTNHIDSLDSLLRETYPLFLRNRIYLGRWYALQGLSYRSQKLSDKSLIASQKALPLLQQANDKIWYGQTLYTIATAYADKGDNRQAVARSMSILAYAKKYGDKTLTLHTYSLLTVIYERLKNLRLKWFYANKMTGLAKNSYIIKAEWYEQQGDWAKAWPYRQKMLAESRTSKDEPKENRILNLKWMATNLRKRGQLREANQYLAEAFQIGQHKSDLATMGSVWEEQALVDLQGGRQQAALRAAQEAVRLTRLSKLPYELAPCLATLATIEESTGHYPQALRTYKEYYTIQNSLTSTEKVEKLAQIQAQYDLDQKEHTIQLLNKNALIQRLKSNEQDQQLNLAHQRQLIFIVSLGILLLLLSMIIYFFYQARTTQRQLAHQKEEIETQANELQEVIQLKNRLFAIIGHDLRSPVASLKARLSLSKQVATGPEPQELSRLEQEVNGLQHTLDNLLYWSLDQQHGLIVTCRLLNLTDLVSSVVDSLEGLIQVKCLRIIVELKPVYLETDENLTLLILRNLLHNAIKFSPVGSAIYLSNQQDGQTTTFLITDEGMGMDLSKSSPWSIQAEKGAGLGLRLSEELMNRMGGSLALDSQAGAGTTVLLSWPTTAGQTEAMLSLARQTSC